MEPTRLSSASTASQLEVGVGRSGILRLSFTTDISRDLGFRGTEILVSSLEGHCRRLGQLDTAARRCCEAHRYFDEQDGESLSTETSVRRELEPSNQTTDIPVDTLDVALVDCISAALSATRGRIYGDSGAAKLLGLKPSTLQSKMRKLGIERARFTATG